MTDGLNDDKYAMQLCNETSSPLMSNLQATYILSMSSSLRTTSLDPRLRTLARRTYVQINRGHRAVPVEDVDTTSKDIVHAVRNACFHASMHNTGHILILEDDAIMLTGASWENINWKLVDPFGRISKSTRNVATKKGTSLPQLVIDTLASSEKTDQFENGYCNTSSE